MNSNKSLWVAVIVVAIIAVGGYLYPQVQSSVFGSSGTRYQHGISVGTDTAPSSNGLKVGNNGTSITKIITGTGILIASNYSSLAASTSLPFDIAVTGVTANDVVFTQFASTTASANLGWYIIGSSASSTAGYITIQVINNTGVAATIPSYIASTTQYLVLDN